MDRQREMQVEDQDGMRYGEGSLGTCPAGVQAILATWFVIAFVFLAVQTAKLAYQGWFEIKGSVLEQFDPSRDNGGLSHASLAELTAKYQVARKAVQDYESDEDAPEVPWGLRSETEPYASEERLKDAIREKEMHRARLHELRSYCLFGVCLIAAGMLCFTRFDRVTGIALLITGFGEMIGYTAPHSRDSGVYSTIQATKIGFSSLAMVLLFIAGYATGVFEVARACWPREMNESEGAEPQ